MPDDKTKKKSFVLRMDPETFRELEKWAADEFRSLNGQIEFLLHRSLRESGRKKNRKSDE
jgi:hypothetical protein